jgi:hypothetical protein
MSFIGSSELWGEDATARLCQIIVDANDGMAQQIAENNTDMLDLLSTKELERIDDCGLSLPFLAVYYDRPDMIRYLHKRGLNLAATCDPMDFGTPMFYAVSMGKIHCVEALDSLGVSVAAVCDNYLKLTPDYFASRLGDQSIADKITQLKERELSAYILFKKNFDKHKARSRYLKVKKAVMTIQRYTRGLLDRIMVRLIKTGAISLYSSSMDSGSDTGSKPRSHASSRVRGKAKGGKKLKESSLDTTSKISFDGSTNS